MNYEIKNAEQPNFYELFKNGIIQGRIIWSGPNSPTVAEFLEELKTNAHIDKMESMS